MESNHIACFCVFLVFSLTLSFLLPSFFLLSVASDSPFFALAVSFAVSVLQHRFLQRRKRKMRTSSAASESGLSGQTLSLTKRVLGSSILAALSLLASWLGFVLFMHVWGVCVCVRAHSVGVLRINGFVAS